MTRTDSYNCPTTIESQDALDQWNLCLKGFLSHGAETGNYLARSLELDPGFALGYACRGLFSLLLGRRELDEQIHTALASAQACEEQNPVTEREKHYIKALALWLNGSPSAAAHEMDLLLGIWPHDALAMKLGHSIKFMLGDALGMRTSLENISHVYRGHSAEGYFTGCYAFALEETGEYSLSEKKGQEALEIAPDDAWGLHAVTHVFDMTGRAEHGLKWISGKDEAWDHCNNFRYHIWWHIALMHLDLGNFERVLELYDDYIRKDKTDDYRDLSNATSVLLRLEIEGVDVNGRWEELAEISNRRAQDNCVAFADLHYMMALAYGPTSQGDASTLLANMSSAALRRQGCEFTSAISNPGTTLARGLIAFREQKFATAYASFFASRENTPSIGGSHAQRDIFTRLGIEAALRAGLMEEARNLLKERDQKRGHQDNYSHHRWSILDNAACGGNRHEQGAA